MLNPNELYTIQRILEEYEIPVCIQKANWSGDFYFRIERIEDGMAKGTAFKHGQTYNRLFGEYKYYLAETARLYGSNTPKYDADGFDKNGYNALGYNRKGYNIYGFDRNGYDSAGYNRYGYDANGYNRDGYDRNGRDKEGYNKEGYSIYGFDKSGYDKNGYNANGYNKWGYDNEGYDKEGYNVSGYDREGFGRNGYNKDGFDREGYNKVGFNSDGYNRNGFNKEGYNKLGYDIEGFNREGYNHRGYDKTGYDRHGYDHKGYNKEGYNKYGINAAGEPNAELGKKYITGKTIVYHDTYGKGVFTKFSTGPTGLYIHVDFDKNKDITFIFPESLGQYIFIDKTEKEEKKEKLLSTEYGKKEYEKEKGFFDRINEEITLKYQEAIQKYEKELFDSQNPTEEGGFFHYTPAVASQETAESKNKLTALYRQPYFAKVDYAGNHNLYIGKQACERSIIDWADPKASLYYEYQMYIGNKEYNLSIVRNFDVYLGQFFGFVDAYNSTMGTIKQTDYSSSTNASNMIIDDERLLMIISAQREDKNIHDIIASIQANQYKIITNSINDELVVEGCAGSGKTMVMLHRLRYLIRNNLELEAKDVCTLSPTEMLKTESGELAETLQLTEVNRYSNISLYKSICKKIAHSNNFFWPESDEKYYPNTLVQKEIVSKLYSEDELYSAVNYIKRVMNNSEAQKEFIKHEKTFITAQKNNLSELGILESTQERLLNRDIEEFKRITKELKTVSIENIEAVVKSITNNKKYKPETKTLRKEALKYLIDHPIYLSKNTAKKVIEKSYVVDNREDAFNAYYNLYKNRNSLKKFGLVDSEDFLEVYSKYEKIEEKENRLVDYITDDGIGYIFDIISACIRDAKEAYSLDTSIHYEWEIFWFAYILLTFFPNFSNTKLVFIDEFQDYSITEYNMLTRYFFKAKFNLFGDFKQSISAKGINAEQFVKIIGIRNPSRFEITENYRNALEITEYVNSKFNMSMRPVGIHGHVQTSTLSSFARIKYDEEDRIAVIVKELEILKGYSIYETANIIRTSADEIKRGIINIMPVSLAKGLEFEIVAIMPLNMDDNEKYVGMTRAMDELYICNE